MTKVRNGIKTGWINSMCNQCDRDMSRPHPGGLTVSRTGETCWQCARKLREQGQRYRDEHPDWDDDD